MATHRLAILLIVPLLLLAGCASTPQDDTVKIGAVLSLSGPAAAFGEAARQGIEMAADEVNANGGIGGKTLVVVYEDDATSAQKATNAFQKVTSVDQVSAVIGGTWDFNYNAIAPMAQEARITLITTENPRTDGLIMNDYTFVMLPGLRPITNALEKHLTEQGIEKVAVVHFASPWGAAVTAGMADIMERNGGKLVLEETYTTIGGNDFKTTIEKLEASGAQAVFIDTVGSDSITFLRQLKESGLDMKVLTHQDIVDSITNPDVDRTILDGVVYFDFTVSPPAFAEKFKARYGRDPRYAADKSYDAVMVLAEALATTQPADVPAYLEQHEFTTINGKFRFVDHGIESKEVLIQRITATGVETIDTVLVQG